MKLIELAITMAYDAKVNYGDVFSQVKMWDVIIYNYLKKKNIVIPPKNKSEKNEKYAGAYVKEPLPGMYDWILSLDLTSLYPSLIMQFNISPETLMDEKYPGITVDKLLNKEVVIENIEGKCVCANGCLYDKNKKGIFPQLVEKIFNERQIFKKKMLNEEKNMEEIENEMKRRGIL
jgi:DNA polymerase elongation subunit (family B)